MKYVERRKLTYVDYKCSRTVQYISCYTMHDIVFSMNIAGDDECSRARCITFYAADPSLRRAATCHVRTLSLGPDGVRS